MSEREQTEENFLSKIAGTHDVDDQPSDELPLSLEQEDDRLKTVNCRNHNESDNRNLTATSSDRNDQVDLDRGNRLATVCGRSIEK